VRVVVTGGAGFIGSHLVDRLVAAGGEVVVVDDLSNGLRENLPGGVELLCGDIRDGDLLGRACHGAEIVWHMAALGSVPRSIEDPGEVWSVNAGGTLAVLEAALGAGVRRFVFASSSSVYGDCGGSKMEGVGPCPISPYGASKAAAEALVHAWDRTYDLETVVLRLFNVFGPRQRSDVEFPAAIPMFVEQCLRGDPIEVYGDGRQTRDWTYVDNAVEALLLAGGCHRTATGRRYNIACGQDVSVEEVIAMIAGELGREAQVVTRRRREGDVRFSRASIGLATHALGYQPCVSLREGIRRLCQEAINGSGKRGQPSGTRQASLGGH
jgi:UDP-glucose 4-epimerase